MIPNKQVKLKKDGTPRSSNLGGKRKGAGRKPKAKEIELIEKLTPLDDIAFKALRKGILAGNYKFTELYFKYRYGNPKTSMDITSNGEGFSIPLISFFDNKQ